MTIKAIQDIKDGNHKGNEHDFKDHKLNVFGILKTLHEPRS
jgi:hypothetical protein